MVPAIVKAPLWSCSCGTVDNWCSRATCRGCNREAPSRIKKSYAEAVKARSASGLGRSAQTSAAADAKLEIAQLRMEIAALRSAQPPEPGQPSQGADKDEGGSKTLDDLVRTRAQMAKTFSAEHPAMVAVQADIDEARCKRDNAKSPLNKVKDAEGLVEKKRKKIEAIEAKAAAARAEVEAVQQKHNKLQDELAEAAAEATDARAKLEAAKSASAASESRTVRCEVLLEALTDAVAILGEDAEAGQALALLRNKITEAKAAAAAEAAAATAAAAAQAESAAGAVVASESAPSEAEMELEDSLDDETKQLVEAAMQSNRAEDVWQQVSKRLKAKTRTAGCVIIKKPVVKK